MFNQIKMYMLTKRTNQGNIFRPKLINPLDM